MATTLTNRIASSALAGEGVQINLDSTDRANLATLTVGTEVTTTAGSTKKGIVVSVDKYGTTLVVAPNTQASRFDGATAGIFSVGEQITY
jgi:hypothetical protein